MAFRARRFEIEVPTISDTSSIYRIVERGYSNLETGDRDILLSDLQTGLLQAVTIPDTGITLNLLKKSLSLKVPGKDWVEYEIDWEEPVTPAAATTGILETCTDQIGPTPAVATLQITGSTIPTEGHALGTTVTITNNGVNIFKGWVVDVAYSGSTGQGGTTVMTAKDIRWFWGGIFVGSVQPLSTTPAYKAADLNEIVFNEGNKPDKDPTGLLFKRGSPSALMWTYGLALKALLTWYNYENLWSVDDNFYDDLPHRDTPMPETDLTGQTLVSAIDQLISFGAETSWGVDFTSSPVKIRLVTTTSGDAKVMNYKTATVDTNYATSCNVSKSIESGYEKVEVHSSRILVETCFVNTEFTAQAVKSLSRFAYIYKLNADAIYSRLTTLGITAITAQAAGDIPFRFSKRLVSRMADQEVYKIWAKSDITDVLLATQCIELEPYIWVTFDSAATWEYLVGGYEIDHETGRIAFGEMIATDDDANIKPRLKTCKWDLVNYDQVKTTTKSIDDTNAFGFTMTAAVEIPVRQLVSNSMTGFTWPNRRVRVIKEDRIPAEYRVATRILDTTSTTLAMSAEMIPDGEAYLDPIAKINDYIAQIKLQNPGITYTAGITAPFAPALHPGDTVSVPNFSKWPVVTMYITAVSYSIQNGTRSINITASNQFWGENAQVKTDPNLAWKVAKEIQSRYQKGYI